MAELIGKPLRVMGGGKGAPVFTYTGTYELVNDDDTTYSGGDNWKIRFLTSGTLTLSKVKGAKLVDIFAVGGGGSGSTKISSSSASTNGTVGGGGGGGYTTTAQKIKLAKNAYTVIIGNGGAEIQVGGHAGNPGEASQFKLNETVLCNANGADAAPIATHGNGGSGGGGGFDGSDGTQPLRGSTSSAAPGKGQGSTTREFGEINGRLYAGGGGNGVQGNSSVLAGGAGGGGTGGKGGKDGGSGKKFATAGEANTGGGGGGSSGYDGGGNWKDTCNLGAAGGSGIVIIRNAR